MSLRILKTECLLVPFFSYRATVNNRPVLDVGEDSAVWILVESMESAVAERNNVV